MDLELLPILLEFKINNETNNNLINLPQGYKILVTLKLLSDFLKLLASVCLTRTISYMNPFYMVKQTATWKVDSAIPLGLYEWEALMYLSGESRGRCWVAGLAGKTKWPDSVFREGLQLMIIFIVDWWHASSIKCHYIFSILRGFIFSLPAVQNPKIFSYNNIKEKSKKLCVGETDTRKKKVGIFAWKTSQQAPSTFIIWVYFWFKLFLFLITKPEKWWGNYWAPLSLILKSLKFSLYLYQLSSYKYPPSSIADTS